MSDNEMNKAILDELVKIAKRVFDAICVNPGTYTAAQLDSDKDSNGDRIIVSFLDELKGIYPDGIVGVRVGTFQCAFEPMQVFRYVSIFERYAGVRMADRVRFTRVMARKAAPICSFKMKVEKRHMCLSKMVARDELCSILQQVYLDAYRRCLVASNGHVIREIPIDIEFDGIVPEGMILTLNPNYLKGMTGMNYVAVYPHDCFYNTVVTNESTGVTYENVTIGMYPRYRECYPKLRADGYIKFAKKELKAIKKFCKASPYDLITLHVAKGERYASISSEYDVTEHRFELELQAGMTMRLGLSAERLCLMHDGWDGGMWLVSPDKFVVMDYDGMGTGVMVSRYIGNSIHPDERECDIDPLERGSYIGRMPERPSALPAVVEATCAEAIPYVSCLSAMVDMFVEIAMASEESIQDERNGQSNHSEGTLPIMEFESRKEPSLVAMLPYRCHSRLYEAFRGTVGAIVRCGGLTASEGKETALSRVWRSGVTRRRRSNRTRGSPKAMSLELGLKNYC